MRERKFLVLSTLAVFCASLGSLAIYRAILAPRPIVIMAKEYPTLGRENAKIEIVVFEEFLCHTCRYFTMEIFPAIESAYTEPGIAKYVMIPLAFSPKSREIANAALAMFYEAPQYYFPFVRELFLRFSDGKFELRDLVEAAEKYEGIDIEAFEASVRAGRYDHELEQNFKVAKKAMNKNLRTPAVFINGFPMSGISFESISQKIEQIKEGK